MRLIARIALALLFVPGLSQADPAAAPRPAPAAAPEPAPVDLQRMMGDWYVIARTPNMVERGHVASRHHYRLDGDGEVDIRYSYREGFAEPERDKRVHASIAADSGNRDWRVWFYRVVPTRQRILEVAPDYSWMLLSWPGRDLAWIFARTADMPTAQYRQLVAKLRDDYGIYTDKLQRIPQRPDQVDKLGFATPEKP